MRKENTKRYEEMMRIAEKYLAYWDLLSTRMLNDPIESFDW